MRYHIFASFGYKILDHFPTKGFKYFPFKKITVLTGVCNLIETFPVRFVSPIHETQSVFQCPDLLFSLPDLSVQFVPLSLEFFLVLSSLDGQKMSNFRRSYTLKTHTPTGT